MTLLDAMTHAQTDANTFGKPYVVLRTADGGEYLPWESYTLLKPFYPFWKPYAVYKSERKQPRTRKHGVTPGGRLYWIHKTDSLISTTIQNPFDSSYERWTRIRSTRNGIITENDHYHYHSGFDHEYTGIHDGPRTRYMRSLTGL